MNRRLIDAASASPKQDGAGNGIRTHAAQRGHRLSRPTCGRRDSLSAFDIHLADFKDFLVVDRQLTTRTVKGHLRQIKRLLETVGSDPRSVTRQALREYLKVFNGRPANTYRNVLKSLRVFFEFLGKPELVSSFKFPPKAVRVVKVTSTEDMRTFYSEINELRAKARFLMYATSGLRRDELLGLKRKDIDPEMRMIIPGGNGN